MLTHRSQQGQHSSLAGALAKLREMDVLPMGLHPKHRRQQGFGGQGSGTCADLREGTTKTLH